MSPDEHAALVADAHARLATLRGQYRRLAPDVDDPWILSEIVAVVADIRRAERVLAGQDPEQLARP